MAKTRDRVKVKREIKGGKRKVKNINGPGQKGNTRVVRVKVGESLTVTYPTNHWVAVPALACCSCIIHVQLRVVLVQCMYNILCTLYCIVCVRSGD